MADDVTSPEGHRWTLTGSWLWNHPFTLVAPPAAAVIVLVVSGLRLASPAPPPWWFPVLGGSRSGVRVRAAAITVPLAIGFPRVPELVDAVAAHRPDLRVGTL